MRGQQLGIDACTCVSQVRPEADRDSSGELRRGSQLRRLAVAGPHQRRAEACRCRRCQPHRDLLQIAQRHRLGTGLFAIRSFQVELRACRAQVELVQRHRLQIGAGLPGRLQSGSLPLPRDQLRGTLILGGAGLTACHGVVCQGFCPVPPGQCVRVARFSPDFGIARVGLCKQWNRECSQQKSRAAYRHAEMYTMAAALCLRSICLPVATGKSLGFTRHQARLWRAHLPVCQRGSATEAQADLHQMATGFRSGCCSCYARCMLLPACLWLGLAALAGAAIGFEPACAARQPQDTGFLNRTVVVNGTLHRYVVYLPENWTGDRKWPVILFLHGSGERGAEGLDQTQVGLPAAIRSHPERWPFVVVMPQVPFNHHYWTDPDMMQTALTALSAEQREFNGDPDRTYLTGLSLGGYGVWELARDNPHTFAAIAPVCGGVFWSYRPSRWTEQTTLPEEYARVLRHEPVWIFHGADDPVVSPRQSTLMYDALKSVDGTVRFYEYAGVKHNVWEKAYANPELPRWLLAHSLGTDAALPPAAEYQLVPVHPLPARINPSLYEAYTGEYEDNGVVQITVFREGDQLMQRNRIGEVTELLPESAATFFYPSGSTSRLIFERDPVTGLVRDAVSRDDRHEERWNRKR